MYLTSRLKSSSWQIYLGSRISSSKEIKRYWVSRTHRRKLTLVVWVGINDVGGLDHTLVEEAMDTIDDILGRCYRLGFRHLLLIDVPPRKLVKPGAKGECTPQTSDKLLTLTLQSQPCTMSSRTI